MTFDNQSDHKIRLLIAAHIGKPIGGISVSYENLLASSLKEFYDLSFVETSKGNLDFNSRGKGNPSNYINALSNIIRFIYSLYINKPEVVHIGTVYYPSFLKHSVMVLIARLSGARVVMQFHCGYDRFFQTSRLGIKWALYILRKCHGVIILSQEWNALQRLIPGIKTCYIPNAIRVSQYLEINRPRYIQKDEPIRILYLGHLGREKGVFDLLQAARILKEISNALFCIDLVGESLYEGEIELINKTIEQYYLGDLVKIHLPEYHQAKIARLAESDIFVLPSYHEGMPISLIEAMASGLPVVATKVGGIPDLIDDGETGFLVDTANPDQLAQKLKYLLENSDEIFRMGKNGQKQAIEKFDIEDKVVSLVDFYYKIMNNSCISSS